MEPRQPGTDALALAEDVRRACLEAAVAGYEDAAVVGLCHDGAAEAAVGAIQRLDLTRLVSARAGGAAGGDPHDSATPPLALPLAALAASCSADGPPGAGSAAAATGALAAGLLEWTARRSARRGPEEFRRRARALAQRAEGLRSRLVDACVRDADSVEGLLQPRTSRTTDDARRDAIESALDIATRCAQVATLCAEVATRGVRAMRIDAGSAGRLAGTAAGCALDLADADLRRTDGEAWRRSAERRAWRARLLLNRAKAMTDADGWPDGTRSA
jgi:formiminotetrahydrofolate cyclodeaminase